jgi:uncharacterized membrane protein YhaH (DUF805 family)
MGDVNDRSPYQCFGLFLLLLFFFRLTVVSPKKHDRSAEEFTLLLFLSQNLLNLIEFTLRLEVDIQS